jgi:hypothetical protein
MKPVENSSNQEIDPQPWTEVVNQQVQSLRFGVVQIIVHDSKVVQIECTERIRIAPQAFPNRTHNADRQTGGQTKPFNLTDPHTGRSFAKSHP